MEKHFNLLKLIEMSFVCESKLIEMSFVCESKLIFTKILNPIPNPKPKISHSFRLHKDLAHQSFVEPSGVQALKNPNPLKDVEALAVLGVVVLV